RGTRTSGRTTAEATQTTPGRPPSTPPNGSPRCCGSWATSASSDASGEPAGACATRRSTRTADVARRPTTQTDPHWGRSNDHWRKAVTVFDNDLTRAPFVPISEADRETVRQAMAQDLVVLPAEREAIMRVVGANPGWAEMSDEDHDMRVFDEL